MVLTMISGLVGGLGLFIYGMHLMSEGLKVVAGNRMKKLLEILTNNTFKAILVGAVVTMIIQSSSTTTVMVVGFVNASLMTLTQAAGVILGANIGTTITAQLIALNITAISPIFIGFGTMLCLFGKKKRTRDLGSIILGFGILFFGISTMSDVMKPLKDNPLSMRILSTYGKNPIWGLLLGTVLTGVMQSSSATVGILQVVALSGVFSGVGGSDAIRICIPVIIGTNIGTCVTALLSSVGTSTTAKKAALVHLFVNIFGAIWVMVILVFMDIAIPDNPIYNWIVAISGSTLNENSALIPNIARQIAMAHTLFNVANMVVILPFLTKLVHYLDEKLPSHEEKHVLQLDSRLLNNPAVALGQVKREICNLSKLCHENFEKANNAVMSGDEKCIKEVNDLEKLIDEHEHGIVDYVVKISSLNMTSKENSRTIFYLKGVHDLERIGDHSQNISELAEIRIHDNITMTEAGINSLKTLIDTVGSILDDVTYVLRTEDDEICNRILEKENLIDLLTKEASDEHADRLNNGECSAHASTIYFDMLSNLERIGDHASNIAVGIKELKEEPISDTVEEVLF